MVPYDHSEVIKEYMIEVAKTILPNELNFADAIESLSLSEVHVTGMFQTVLYIVIIPSQLTYDCNVIYWHLLNQQISLIINARLAVFVRFFTGKAFNEEFLTLTEFKRGNYF